MYYYIDKRYFGSKCHIVLGSGEPVLIEKAPADLLVENGTCSPGTLKSFLQICGEVHELIPENILKSLHACEMPVELAGLKHIVRPTEAASLLAVFQRTVDNSISSISGYIPFYIKNIKTLNSCLSMKFLPSFKSIPLDCNGFAEKVIYDTTSTKTGRMSVVSGPSVLTMQKGFKSSIQSRYQGGKIIEIDYSALEPRVALALANSPTAKHPDVYSSIGEQINITDRGVVKQLIISFLYGAGMATMQRLTGLSSTVLKPKLTILKQMFHQDKIVEDIRIQLASSGSFTNHAGRPIFPGSDKPGLLFNNYCQSTAVDVALSGFANLIADIKAAGIEATPLCFIHDAILLDVTEHDFSRIKKMSSSLHTYLGIDFPTKLTVVNN